MQIGELSARTGATVRMLRYYEENGLLTPERTGSGYRIYAESDVERVRYIRCMLSSAVPTSVIAEALRFLLNERPAIPELPEERARLAEALQAELEALTERISVLNRSREQLARFVDDVRGEVVGPLQARPEVGIDVGPAVRQGAPLAGSRNGNPPARPAGTP
ncbi:MAG TPA: MerR family transcriptional regulator [Micromonosporaceae bacterium]|nr:MerR family transcriptional regulator [Micromonosporaceae bacterium]